MISNIGPSKVEGNGEDVESLLAHHRSEDDSLSDSLLLHPPTHHDFGKLSDLTSSSARFSMAIPIELETVRLLQIANVLISMAVSVYFILHSDYYISLQYLQVCFISTLTVILDAQSATSQHCWLALGVLIAIWWSFIVLWTAHLYMDYQPINYFASSVVACFFVGSMLYATYTILHITTPITMKRVELDLLLYLASLNAICFFSTDSFNANLHMILDIRTIVFLFNGLYQPKDKILLLKSKAFIGIIFLMVAAYIIDGVPNSPLCHFVSNAMYVLIGIILIYESIRIRRYYQAPSNNTMSS